MDKSIPPFAAHLLNFIGDIEAPRGYDTVYGNNQSKLPKPVTSMTIAEVQSAQASWTKRFGSSATGRYQFMRATLGDLIKELKLNTSVKFSADLQDRLAFHLLKRRGYEKFVDGSIGMTAFGKMLAQEWASLPVLSNTKGAHRQVTRGQSYYAGDGVNKSLVAPERVEAALRVNLPGTIGAVPTPPLEPPIVIVPPTTPPKPPGSQPGDGTAAAGGLGLGAILAGLWQAGSPYALYITIAVLVLVGGLLAYRAIAGRFPWTSTGEASPEPLAHSPPSLAPSLEQLSEAQLALQSAALPAEPLPVPSESKPHPKRSDARSLATRKRSKSSKPLKPRKASASAPRRKSKSSG